MIYRDYVLDLEQRIEKSDIFGLFDILKRLAVLEKSLELTGDSKDIVLGLIERVQERIFLMKL